MNYNFEGTKVMVDKTNKRLKVYEYKADSGKFEELVETAKSNQLDKIILFQKEEKNSLLDENGFQIEGKIMGFFNGIDAYLYTKYLTDERQTTYTIDEEDSTIKKIQANPPKVTKSLPENYVIRSAKEQDIPEIVEIFDIVFKSYPSPMNDPAYVKEALETNVDMAVVENEEGKLVGLSSAEIDFENNNAELTDCATLPSERGKGINNHLIRFLENKMNDRGVTNLFSIARAQSFGMNKVLYNLQYHYTGRLYNNVHIAGDWENMNIWSKQVK